jgi:hypothetical protein
MDGSGPVQQGMHAYGHRGFYQGTVHICVVIALERAAISAAAAEKAALDAKLAEETAAIAAAAAAEAAAEATAAAQPPAATAANEPATVHGASSGHH